VSKIYLTGVYLRDTRQANFFFLEEGT